MRYTILIFELFFANLADFMLVGGQLKLPSSEKKLIKLIRSCHPSNLQTRVQKKFRSNSFLEPVQVKIQNIVSLFLFNFKVEFRVQMK